MHYTGNSELVLYGRNAISSSDKVIEKGASQLYYTPSNTIVYYEGGDNIANEWVASEEDP